MLQRLLGTGIRQCSVAVAVWPISGAVLQVCCMFCCRTCEIDAQEVRQGGGVAWVGYVIGGASAGSDQGGKGQSVGVKETPCNGAMDMGGQSLHDILHPILHAEARVHSACQAQRSRRPLK